MTLLWSHYWPVVAAAMIMGLLAGALAYGPAGAAPHRLPQGNRALLLGGLVACALVAAWHGPLGAGDRLAKRIETAAAAELQRQEMGLVQARLRRRPLTRQLLLSGPADDFQRRELVRIMGGLPGVGSVRWASPPDAREAR